MGKKSKSQPATEAQSQSGVALPFLAGNTSVDPTVASLFEKSVSAIAMVFRLGLVTDVSFNG